MFLHVLCYTNGSTSSGSSMSGNHGPCRFCVLCLLAIAFLALLFYLTYHPIKPRYYLTTFSIRSPGATLVVADFKLAIANRNKELGLYHDDLNLNLSLVLPSSNSSSSPPPATAVVPGFYQGHKKTAFKDGSFASSSNSSKGRWAAAAANGSAVLRVAVESAVRYKAIAWRSRRHRVSVAATVKVDREGNKTAEDWIRLRSRAPPVHRNAALRHSVLAVAFVACAAMRC